MSLSREKIRGIRRLAKVAAALSQTPHQPVFAGSNPAAIAASRTDLRGLKSTDRASLEKYFQLDTATASALFEPNAYKYTTGTRAVTVAKRIQKHCQRITA